MSDGQHDYGYRNLWDFRGKHVARALSGARPSRRICPGISGKLGTTRRKESAQMNFPRMGFGFALLTLVIASTGCQNKVADENKDLWRQNRELQARLKESDARQPTQGADPAQITALQAQLAQRDQQIADLQGQLRQPAPQQAPAENNALAGIEVTKDEAAGTMTVNLPGDVLFASGHSDLKDSAKTTLNKVISAVRKQYPGKKVIVKGYTDTDPISKTKNKWQDNLDLSAARARTVAQYLVTQGLDQNHVGLQALGDTMPRGSKDRSRRVEIVVATR